MSNLSSKEKAIEIFEKFYSHKWQKHTSTRNYKIESMTKSSAKWCSNQLVNEIINLDNFSIEGREYWEQVKQEIEKL
jgi:hypothetical protein